MSMELEHVLRVSGTIIGFVNGCNYVTKDPIDNRYYILDVVNRIVTGVVIACGYGLVLGYMGKLVYF